MIDIDYIMALLDDRKSTEEQSKGLEMAKSIKCIRGFVMPKSIPDHQYYWENCARVLAGKTDDELNPFLLELFNWIRNMDNSWTNFFWNNRNLTQIHPEEPSGTEADHLLRSSPHLRESPQGHHEER